MLLWHWCWNAAIRKFFGHRLITAVELADPAQGGQIPVTRGVTVQETIHEGRPAR